MALAIANSRLRRMASRKAGGERPWRLAGPGRRTRGGRLGEQWEGASESTKISQAYGAEFGVVLGRAAIDMRHMYEYAKDIKVTIEDSSTIKASVPALNYNEGFAPYVWGLHGYLEQTSSTEGEDNQLLVIDHWVSY